MSTCWHLDTSALVERSIFKCLVSKAKFTYKVSVVALGELLLKYSGLQSRNGWERHLYEVAKLIDKIIHPYVATRRECPVGGGDASCDNISKVLQKVLETDYHISVNDALIIAHALVDEDCAGLITTDRKILRSESLHKLAREYGKKLVGPEHLGCGRE